MTDAQKTVLEECYGKLSEHFTAFVVVTMTEDDAKSPPQETLHATHSGGFHTVVGLLAQAQHDYLNKEMEGAE